MKLNQITLDPKLQCRARLDQDAIEDYSKVYANGGGLPAIEVWEVDGTYYVTDGFHRVHGAYAAHLEEIDAEVHKGTFQDALRAALRANVDNGMRRTSADKRKCVKLALKDPEIKHYSLRDIGEICRVSHQFVKNVKDGKKPVDPQKKVRATKAPPTQEEMDTANLLECLDGIRFPYDGALWPEKMHLTDDIIDEMARVHEELGLALEAV